MASPRLPALAGLAALLVGCAGPPRNATAPVVAAPETSAPAVAPPAVAVKIGTSAKEALAKPAGFFRTRPTKRKLPSGILVVKEDPKRGRPPVEPTPIDVDALPLVSLPEAFTTPADENVMDHAAGPVIVDEVVQSWKRNAAATTKPVYVRLGARLARIQIGSVGPAFSASSRVYRTCYPTRTHAMVQTMRWQTLGVDADTGKPVLQIGDGWFDSASCKASTVRTTRVELEPLLGGLVHGFRVKCDDCAGGSRLAVVAPRIRNVHVSGLGGPVLASHADFTLIQLPLRRGGAASLSATVDEHAARTWGQAHPDVVTIPMGGRVAFGLELAHTVSSPTPTAIAYATVIRR